MIKSDDFSNVDLIFLLLLRLKHKALGKAEPLSFYYGFDMLSSVEEDFWA